jgi:integrase
MGGIYKRNNIWWISYQSGRKQVRESSYSTNKRVAEKLRAKRQTEAIEGRLGLPRSNSPRLDAWSQEYLDAVPHQNTKDRYSTSVKHLTTFFGQRIRLQDITPEGIYKFQRNRLSNGVMMATVNRDITVLSGMLRKAKKIGYISQNPCQDVDWLKEANERREARPLNPEEENRLLAVCEPLLRIFIIVLLETGLRPKKEALPLEWVDVDLDGPEPAIYVRKSKTRAGIRRVLLTDFCANSLRKWKKFLGSNYSNYVFPAPLNPKRHWTVYQDAWERATKAANLRNRRVYDLRSTFATRALESYPHNIAVAKLLGHKTPLVLPAYAKAPDGSASLIVDRLNRSRADRKANLTIQ